LEVVVGALHLPDNNNSSEEQKQAFSTKNRVVVLSKNTQTFVRNQCFVEEKPRISRKLDFFLLSETVRSTGLREEEKHTFFPKTTRLSSFRPTQMSRSCRRRNKGHGCFFFS